MEVDSGLHQLPRLSVHLQHESGRAQWSKEQASMVTATAVGSWSEVPLCAGFLTVYLTSRKSLQRRVSVCPVQQHIGKNWEVTRSLV